MTSGFHRLHPHLRHAIRHDLGWQQLRPVQELAIEAMLDGANAVILAPTAGGKTEASLFPVLSRILTEELDPVAALYVCPIRALLNNQEERLGQYARMVGLDVFKWHGDVSASRKAGFRDRPAHVLMTTPESLEVMLVSQPRDAARLFAGLSMIVIDEVHAFAGDDRGSHLMCLLERLTRLCERDLQRIGLSATVGNPEAIGRWLQGSSRRPFKLVDPPKAPVVRDLRVDYRPDLELAAAAIADQARGKKSLVFVESRARAEKVAHALEGRGVEVFLHHSAISRTDRALAERQFAEGENTAIVCTSTLELGIDVGDLDQVLQVDSPGTVASWLQRLGRTGRRPGARANGSFVCLSSEALLQACALLRLMASAYVEPVVPSHQAHHVLAHQVLALTLQEGGISRHAIRDRLGVAYPITGIEAAELGELIDTMCVREILYEADGLLSLGRKGEALYGRKHFFDLYAVFTAPPVLTVKHHRDEIGQLDAGFLQGHPPDLGPLMFRLAGRAWVVVRTDWEQGVVWVEPAEAGKVPTWLGQPAMLSYRLCQEMRAVLLEPGPEENWLMPAAERELAGLREGYRPLLAGASAPLEEVGDAYQWHTFAGGAANRLLAFALGRMTGERWVAGNLSVKGKATGMAEVRGALRELAGIDWRAYALKVACEVPRGRVSKFQPCLPPDIEAMLLANRLLDVEGVETFLRST